MTATTADPVPGNDSATATTTTAAPSADLAVTKTGPTTVTPGVAYPYTVTVTDHGPSTATAVTLTDTLPPGVTLSAASGATCAGSPVVCDVGTVAPGGSVTVTLTVLPAASLAPGTVLTNTATVSSAAADPVPANNTATATADTGPRSSSVTLTKTSPASMTAGETVTYTITATNAGPSDATVVVATDTLDPRLSFVSSTPPGCTASAGVVTCPLGTVPAGASRSVTLTLLVASDTPAGTIIANGATATSPDQPNIPPAPLTPGPPVQTSADLAVTKTGPGTVTAGATIDYTITLTNNGPSDVLGGLTEFDTLPAGVELVSTSGAPCAGVPLHCDLGNLPAGGVVTITVTVRLAPNVATGTSHTNTVTVSSPTPDPDTANNTASTTTVVGPASADLALDKTGPATPAPGAVVAYQLTYTNNGPSDAAGASITDTLPAQLTFLASDPAGCTAAGQVVTCPVGAVTAGASATITVTAKLASGTAGGVTLTNDASISASTADPVPGNNSATATATTGAPSANLTLTKTAPATVTPGAPFDYVLTATNLGPSDAASVTLTDAGVTGVTADSATGATCTFSPLSCSLGTLAAGTTTTVTVHVTPDASLAPGTVLTNTAQLNSPTPDPVPAGRTATASTTVGAGSADLSITKTGTASATPGEPVSYAVTVTNIGPSDAAGVLIEDFPAAELIDVSGPGCIVTDHLLCPQGTLAAGASVTVTVTAMVDPAVTATSTSNTATVRSDTTDLVPANNSATATTALNPPSADLAVTKTGPATVIPGGGLSYSVIVTNNGPSIADDVVVTDTPGAGIINLSLGDCPTTGCSVGVINPGQSITVLVSAQADPALPGGISLINTASATSATADPVPGNNSGSTTAITSAPGADLTTTMTGTVIAPPGGPVTYTVTVVNNGPSDAAGVVLTDTPGSGLLGASAPGLHRFAVGVRRRRATRPGQRLVHRLGHRRPGASPRCGGTNSATVTETTIDPGLGDETATASTGIVGAPGADLTTTMTGTVITPPGGPVTYTVTVVNNGPDDAAGVVLTDTPGSGLLGASAPGCTGSPLVCDVGALPPRPASRSLSRPPPTRRFPPARWSPTPRPSPRPPSTPGWATRPRPRAPASAPAAPTWPSPRPVRPR